MSIKIIARPRPGTEEPDLLAGREFHSLHIIDHDGSTVEVVQPPENGWDHPAATGAAAGRCTRR